MVVHELGISTKSRSSPGVSRRELLLTTAITLIFSTTSALAAISLGSMIFVSGVHFSSEADASAPSILSAISSFLAVL